MRSSVIMRPPRPLIIEHQEEKLQTGDWVWGHSKFLFERRLPFVK